MTHRSRMNFSDVNTTSWKTTHCAPEEVGARRALSVLSNKKSERESAVACLARVLNLQRTAPRRDAPPAPAHLAPSCTCRQRPRELPVMTVSTVCMVAVAARVTSSIVRCGQKQTRGGQKKGKGRAHLALDCSCAALEKYPATTHFRI
jgi:hypothetical protein